MLQYCLAYKLDDKNNSVKKKIELKSLIISPKEIQCHTYKIYVCENMDREIRMITTI